MLRTELLEQLHRGLLELRLPVDKTMELLLVRYIELISQWNRVFNLTAIRDLEAMVTRHLLDSLTLEPLIKGKLILDVGTGAGLPGIPLAIVLPERQFVLLDSNQKKTRFLQQTVYQLKLKNIRVVHCRVEEFQTDTPFDTMVSRAFSTLKEFMDVSKHLIKPKGQILAMKGVYPLTEIQEIDPAFRVVSAHPAKVPYLDAERHIVELRYEPQSVMESLNE